MSTMSTKNCYYTAQGQLLCQYKPLFIDETGVLSGTPKTKVFWDNVPVEKNPVCLSDLPCCKVSQETSMISKDIFCKPDGCCK